MVEKRSIKQRISLIIEPELDKIITTLAKQSGVSKSELMRRALELMRICVKAKKDGHRVCIIDEKNEMAREITGLA